MYVSYSWGDSRLVSVGLSHEAQVGLSYALTPSATFRAYVLSWEKACQKLETWGAKYGPVFMIQLLNENIIVINDNTVFQEMCDNGNFDARHKSLRFDILACSEKDGIPKDFFLQEANEKHQYWKHFTLGLIDQMRKRPFLSS